MHGFPYRNNFISLLWNVNDPKWVFIHFVAYLTPLKVPEMVLFNGYTLQYPSIITKVMFTLYVNSRNYYLWCLHNFDLWRNKLTLNVRGPSNLGLTRSIPWLLMPWLLTPPGHQQPWYWLCRICKSWSYSRKDFKYLCHMEWWHKM